MPRKIIELSGQVDVDESMINKEGFPKIDKAVSPSTAYRIGKNKNEIICDPACDIKSRKALAEHLKAKHGKYGSEKAVSRLEQNSLDYVEFGKNHFYCTDTVDHHIKNIHEPKVKETKLSNFKFTYQK